MPNLQKVFDRPEMTLSDLRLLGQQGEAILYLVNGRQAIVRPKFAVVQEKRMVNGNWQVVSEEILRFHEIYSVILTVKRKHFIIAERINRNGDNLLVLTGVGYHRQRNE